MYQFFVSFIQHGQIETGRIVALSEEEANCLRNPEVWRRIPGCFEPVQALALDYGTDVSAPRIQRMERWTPEGVWEQVPEGIYHSTGATFSLRCGEISPWDLPQEFHPLTWKPRRGERRYAIAAGGPLGGAASFFARTVQFWDELTADEVRGHVYSWRADCRRAGMRVVEYDSQRERWESPDGDQSERVFYDTPGRSLTAGGPDRYRVYTECGVEPPRPEDADRGHTMRLRPHPAVLGEGELREEAAYWRSRADRVVGDGASPARQAYLKYTALCEKFAERRVHGIKDLSV